ncbi:Asp-tRNA(Asn)/Glu-tRNA(Gln) amidotransferase GatCAB subunit C [Candidatus Shapirobacteria bacterium CG_4_9_14_0_2_um_filter_39_11]|uniref:Aspartyl/glutamyl-tRNA(Asn/Gln) amidotransferase subunit C n=1 Tax=Candidatus Shapirobacteria bacterium CG_4_9_14_0_2_um_filter_39_11 TaxID=1974478 RepID=A0A2M8ESQ8_9BACT|nr:MAG: Asp-tRNA(Asn)/Glu-tRNA(Gln) amidotransferase GatCAB subunit C [Candidatus Shapirobacteria bacterium CG_4_9_14_0_2_um_filter_39_11]
MKKTTNNKQQTTKLTEEEVKHVAKLARLTLTPRAVKKFQKQLSEVLDYIEILKKVKTKGVGSTFQVTGLESVFREDKVAGPSLPQKEVLSGSKSIHNGMFKIKAIFE